MLTHIWSMTFASDATAAQREAFVAAMEDLPNAIDGVESFRHGTDLGLNPGNFDVTIIAEFVDADAWRSYLEAQAHVAFVDDHVTPLCAAWGAIQFDHTTN